MFLTYQHKYTNAYLVLMTISSRLCNNRTYNNVSIEGENKYKNGNKMRRCAD